MEGHATDNKMTVSQMFKNAFQNIFVGDKKIWILIILLMGYSLLAIYSSSLSLSYQKYGGNYNYFLFNQIKMMFFGILTYIIVRFIPISFYKRRATVLYLLSLVLMIVTVLYGSEINGARRWLSIFGIFTIQTSDILRIGIFILLAKILWLYQDNMQTTSFVTMKHFKKNKLNELFFLHKRAGFRLLMPPFIAVAIIIPQNLSTGLVILILVFIMFIIGRVRRTQIFKMILIMISVLILGGTLLYAFQTNRFNTWIGRVESFIDNNDPLYDDNGDVVSIKQMSNQNKQRIHSDIAIANGWFLGRGLGGSVQRSNLPNSNSDFIYSSIVEEGGLVGGVFVLFFYIWILYRCLRISQKCKDSFSAILCISMGILFCGSAFSHIAVCIGYVPVTGLTLPLISHGGSSIMFSFIVLGIILRISYEQQLDAKRLKTIELLEEEEEEEKNI